MRINILAKSFLDLRSRKDEKRRVIDFDYKNHLKALESQATDVVGKLEVIKFKDQIQASEGIYQQLDAELKKVAEDLKPLLAEVNATRHDPLTTHVKDSIYFDVWLDEEGKIQSAGTYHKG